MFVLWVLFSNSDSKSESYQKMIGKEGLSRQAVVDGIWWFITPEGKKFISLGVNHIEPILLWDLRSVIYEKTFPM